MRSIFKIKRQASVSLAVEDTSRRPSGCRGSLLPSTRCLRSLASGGCVFQDLEPRHPCPRAPSRGRRRLVPGVCTSRVFRWVHPSRAGPLGLPSCGCPGMGVRHPRLCPATSLPVAGSTRTRLSLDLHKHVRLKVFK